MKIWGKVKAYIAPLLTTEKWQKLAAIQLEGINKYQS